jgi:hypothetical protein
MKKYSYMNGTRKINLFSQFEYQSSGLLDSPTGLPEWIPGVNSLQMPLAASEPIRSNQLFHQRNQVLLVERPRAVRARIEKAPHAPVFFQSEKN